jgi:hypothetical protein
LFEAAVASMMYSEYVLYIDTAVDLRFFTYNFTVVLVPEYGVHTITCTYILEYSVLLPALPVCT